MNNNIKLNGSGYYDVTAYKAITNTTRRGVEVKVKRGEIWEAETASGEVRELLVIQCFEDYLVTLNIVDKQPLHTYMNIKSTGLKYIDCARLGYCYYDRLVNFVRALSDEEMDEVAARIIGALDLSACDTGSPATSAPVPARSVEPAENSDYAYKALENERDIYKQLYDKLLDDLMRKLVRVEV